MANSSIRLTFAKLSKEGFWNENNLPTVYLPNVTVYSLRLADAERFLLFGEDDSEEMRLLIIPRNGGLPEIKPMGLTFAEAKSRLEMGWEKQLTLWEEKKKKEWEKEEWEEEEEEEKKKRILEGNAVEGADQTARTD